MTACQDVVIPITIMVLSAQILLNLLPFSLYIIVMICRGKKDNIVLFNVCKIVRCIIFILILGLAISYYKNNRPGTRNTSTANTGIIVLSVINLLFVMIENNYYKPRQPPSRINYTVFIILNIALFVLPCIEAYLNNRRPLFSDIIILPQPLSTSFSSMMITPPTSMPVHQGASPP